MIICCIPDHKHDAVQALPGGSLARCKQVLEVATALRAALYSRAHSLQLLKAPFSIEPVDMSLFRQPGDAEAATTGADATGILLALHFQLLRCTAALLL